MNNCLLPPRSVLIAHPGTQHSHQTALGLYKAGLLKKFLTGFFYSPNPVLKRLFSALPAETATSFLNQLRRRRRADLPPEALHTFPYFDLASIVFAKLPILKNFCPLLSHLHKKLFSFMVLKQIKLLRPKVLIGYESLAHHYFKICTELGICKILDHTTGSVFKGKEIYSHEGKAFPLFSKNLSIDLPEIYYQQHQHELELADGILVASNYARANLIEHGVDKNKIYLLPYGADLPAFSYPSRSYNNNKDCIRLVYAGVINQHKGIMYLIQAFQELNQQGLELIIAGKNLLPESIQKSLPPGIKILGHLAKTDLIELYKNSDIFVFPAIHEGSSLAIYEAMASGLPVITTPNAGSIIQNGKNGLIIQSGNIAELKQKILLLVGKPELRKELGAQAAESVKDYSWEKYHARLMCVVKDIYCRYAKNSIAQKARGITWKKKDKNWSG